MVNSFQFEELQWFLCPSVAPKHGINYYNAKDLKKKKKKGKYHSKTTSYRCLKQKKKGGKST